MITILDASKYNDFTIRIRFHIPAHKLNIEESVITVGTSSIGRQIKLKSADLESPIKDADWLILVSPGWESEQDAAQNAVPLMDSLCRSLTFHNLGADLGRRTPGGGFFRAYLDKLEKETGEKFLNDEKGIMIFATDQKPMVAKIGDATLTRSVGKEQWAATFQKAVGLYEKFTDRESMAFDLFTMAHKVEQSADARFVLLFSAFETLLEPNERPKLVRDHVDKLIEETKNTELPKSEKDSLVGTLRWMRSYSIRVSGRQYVRRCLGDLRFGEVGAEELFSKCYELRNRLLHGQQPYADWREVSEVAAPLEQMISKLLSGRLVGS